MKKKKRSKRFEKVFGGLRNLLKDKDDNNILEFYFDIIEIYAQSKLDFEEMNDAMKASEIVGRGKKAKPKGKPIKVEGWFG